VRCYIGRTENFIARFRDHSAKKEFWDRVVLITSKDDSFTEGHWGYLERKWERPHDRICHCGYSWRLR
jgi:hypothetical protein